MTEDHGTFWDIPSHCASSCMTTRLASKIKEGYCYRGIMKILMVLDSVNRFQWLFSIFLKYSLSKYFVSQFVQIHLSPRKQNTFSMPIADWLSHLEVCLCALKQCLHVVEKGRHRNPKTLKSCNKCWVSSASSLLNLKFYTLEACS